MLADADRRAEEARTECARLRDENERQAEIHAMRDRELQEELASSRAESEQLHGKLTALQARIADATRAFEAIGSAERRLNEIAEGAADHQSSAGDDPGAD